MTAVPLASKQRPWLRMIRSAPRPAPFRTRAAPPSFSAKAQDAGQQAFHRKARIRRTAKQSNGTAAAFSLRFGVADDVLAAGEGIETMLSLRCALPTLPTAAALSANHLSAILLPSGLRQLYIARDVHAAGDAAQAFLAQRAEAAGIAITLSPRLGDFNEDLHVFGLNALRAVLLAQLAPEDVDRFLFPSTEFV